MLSWSCQKPNLEPQALKQNIKSQRQNLPMNQLISKFFELPSNASPFMQNIAQFWAYKEREAPYLADFIPHYGLPQWHYTLQITNDTSKTAIGFIPLISLYQDEVSGYIVAKKQGDSLAFQLYDKQHILHTLWQTPSDSLKENAKVMLSIIAQFEKKIYGQTQLVIDNYTFRPVDMQLSMARVNEFPSPPCNSDIVFIQVFQTDPQGNFVTLVYAVNSCGYHQLMNPPFNWTGGGSTGGGSSGWIPPPAYGGTIGSGNGTPFIQNTCPPSTNPNHTSNNRTICPQPPKPWGNPTRPPWQMDFSPAFNKIVDWSKTDKNDPDIKELDKEIDRLYKASCLFRCLIDQLANARPDGRDSPFFKLSFKFVPHFPTSGKYDPYSQTIRFNYEIIGSKGFSAVVHEELLHAYQDVFDRTYYRNIPPNGLGIPNIEVDAKLMIDIENFRYEINTGSKLHQKQRLVNRTYVNEAYDKYLKDISNNGTTIPSTSAALNTDDFNYTDVLNMFKEAYIDTPYNQPIDDNKEPTALLRLAQTCNCN